MKTLAFTGLRPHKMPFAISDAKQEFIALRNAIREQITTLIETENVRSFICGMALRIDVVCCKTVIELKETYSDLTIEAALPCSNQDVKWNAKDREIYHELLTHCDTIHTISEAYTPTCMIERNYYMVDKADILLAVWNNKPGGTAKTVKYANAQDVPTIIINPRDFIAE